jgi:riboflavin biosynthesis pyrimidine reductase
VSGWRERFARLVERKTRQALSATLLPYATELDRHDQTAIGIGNEWTIRLFDGPFYLQPSSDPRRPACSLVFVQSRDGNTGASNPSTLGGGTTDKHLVYEGLSRVGADAVLAGAATVRGSDVLLSVWHPALTALRESLGKARHPIQLVATLEGLDIEGALMFNAPEVPAIVMTVPAAAERMRPAIDARPWVSLVVMRDAAGLPEAFEELRARGVARVSAIGGRRLAEQLIDNGLVQDVYLTTAPLEGGEPGTPMYSKPLRTPVVLRKHGTGSERGVVFEHVLLGRA